MKCWNFTFEGVVSPTGDDALIGRLLRLARQADGRNVRLAARSRRRAPQHRHVVEVGSFGKFRMTHDGPDGDFVVRKSLGRGSDLLLAQSHPQTRRIDPGRQFNELDQ